MFSDYWWLVFFLVFFIPLAIQYQKKAESLNKEGRCGLCGIALAQGGQIQPGFNLSAIQMCPNCVQRRKQQMLINIITLVVGLCLVASIFFYYSYKVHTVLN